MNIDQTGTMTAVEPTQQGVVETSQIVPLTNGYVPIVGVPENPVIVVPDTDGAETKFTVSALTDGTQLGTTSTAIGTRACKVNFLALRQFRWVNGAWSEVTTTPYPFTYNFSLDAKDPITASQQLETSIRNADVGKAKIEITYWVGEDQTNARGKITFQRG